MLNFLGIGAQKTGTTWLYQMLLKHPKLDFPGGKELHFWNAIDYRERFSWYKGVFQNDHTINGEITPAYSMLSRERVEVIHGVYPELKIIYILRNPIERAWSSALMALRRAEMEIDEASNQWFIDHFHSRGSLSRGDYLSCLHVWQSCFPQDQLLVLQYDELCSEPRMFLEKCVKYIGLEPSWVNELSDEMLQTRVFAGEGYPIPEALMPELIAIYGPMMRKISTLIDGDATGWLLESAENS